MNEGPVTQPSLLLRIRDSNDQVAWRQFVDVYAPIIHQYASRKCTDDNDAADVTQEVLRLVATSIGRFNYDKNKGNFRGWLFTVTRNQVINHGKRIGKTRGSGRTDIHEMLDSQPAPNDEQSSWEKEYQQSVFTYACSKVSAEFAESTWDAFQLTAVDGKKAEEAAMMLSLSVGAVYVAKSRVIARLREYVEEISDNWDGVNPLGSG